MEKKTSPSIHLLKPIKKLFRQFHLTIFFICIVACLAGAVILINNSIKESSADLDYTSSINAGSIDNTTLNRLNSLHTSNEGLTEPTIPAGRINPFGE